MNENFTAGLPERFRRNVLNVCGAERGGRWLEDLPKMIAGLEEKWSVRAGKHFPNLSFNYVAQCVAGADRSEAVLKIGLPLKTSEIFDEAAFLQFADGRGAVRLLQFDKTQRAMLLEKLTPGKNLKELFGKDKENPVEIAINLMGGLWRKPPENARFRQLEEWFRAFDRAENAGFPKKQINKARKIFEKLNSDSNKNFLLHGDLHHENILSTAGENFRVIDPKGIIGQIGYEISVFLNNHAQWLLSEQNSEQKLIRAVRQFSASFSIEPEILKKWAFVQMVLSACWEFEDNAENWENDLEFAEIWGQNSQKLFEKSKKKWTED